MKDLEGNLFDEDIAKHLGQSNATDKVIQEFTSEIADKKDASKSNIDFKTLLTDDEVRIISRIESIGAFLQNPITFKEKWIAVDFSNRIKRLMTSRDGTSRGQLTSIFTSAREEEVKARNGMMDLMRSRDANL